MPPSAPATTSAVQDGNYINKSMPPSAPATETVVQDAPPAAAPAAAPPQPVPCKAWALAPSIGTWLLPTPCALRKAELADVAVAVKVEDAEFKKASVEMSHDAMAVVKSKAAASTCADEADVSKINFGFETFVSKPALASNFRRKPSVGTWMMAVPPNAFDEDGVEVIHAGEHALVEH
mmetsp:Transcript_36732/g.97902  ORF Transcript_36732/g.97902 Transcript_36732/m.97902 type:complete len:178 (-) Transcript_36732:61-594(-)